jgi:quercetin dioxygenase-like cupin family protein
MSTAPRPQPTAQDRVNLDPKHYAVELENERVRVLRITYGPHEKSVMHGHPSIVTVNLTDAHLKFTYHDGKTEIIEARAGQVLSFPAFENLPENLSDKPYEAIAIELK